MAAPPLSCSQDAARPLNGLSTSPQNRRRGFELMNGGAGTAEIRHIFAARSPRGDDAWLAKNAAEHITSVDNAVTGA
jgi:hypothetical protein